MPIILVAQFEVNRDFLYTAPMSQNAALPQCGRVNFVPEITSNLYDYRSSDIEQHYFQDEQVDKPGPSHAPKMASIVLL